jgi:uncharacterized phiE125 gp8 family phage protein
MGLKRTVEPSTLAVGLADAKPHCEVGDSDTSQDVKLTRMISAAIADVERHTRKALITQTWVMTLREFPVSDRGRIYLPRPPLQTVSSIVYVNDAGSSVTLSTSDYQVVTGSSPGYVEPAFNKSWPSVRSETAESITITYVAGFGSAATSIPAALRNVILELTAFRFVRRGDEEVHIPKHVMWALESNKCGAKYDYFGIKN